MKIIICCLAIMYLLYGCESTVNENNSYDYSIEQKLGCFCPQGGEWIKLFVKADTIADAVQISNNSHLPYEGWARYKTISGLFNVISQIDTAHYDYAVTIDSVNHYPSYVYFNPKPYIHGDTVSIIRDAQMSYTTQKYIKLN